MTKKIFSLAAIVTLAIQFFGCSKDEETKASMSITVDGIAQPVSILSTVLVFEAQEDHEGRAMQTTAQSNSNLLTVGISNWDFQNPPINGILQKTYYDVEEGSLTENADCLEEGDIMYCDGYLITYTVNNETFYSAMDDEYEGTLTVTKCDVKNKKISGEFSCKLVSVDENEIIMTGKFQNLSYLVLE